MSRRPPTQRQFEFVERNARTERRFKIATVLTTILVMAALVISFEAGRSALLAIPNQLATVFAHTRDQVVHAVTGLEPTRADIDALNRLQRERSAADTLRSVTRFYASTSQPMQTLFDEAGMAPGNCLIGVGRPSNAFLLSSLVFEGDDTGRSYRLKPNTASVWLRQLTLIDGPFALFLVPDTPSVRKAAHAAGAIVDETSRQTTNSWGLRGPEPDMNAEIRGIVLGDSFMQGMFNDDQHTPPLLLQEAVERTWSAPTSILNTGHIGYGPEQYCATLREFGPRFNPHFIVVSVCPNDFGDGDDVISGKGDDWDEATYWIGEILLWCRGKNIPCVLVPAPLDRYIVGMRKDGWYPARVSNLFQGTSYAYCNPFEYFLEEHIKAHRAGFPAGRSPLFNHQINDNHFSPQGAALWAKVVADRITSLMAKPAAKQAPIGSQSGEGAQSSR